MKQRMVLIISVIVGLIAFWFTQQYFQSRLRDIAKERERVMAGARMVDVVAAAQALPVGTVIQKKDLKMKPTLARDAGKNTVLPSDFEQILNKKLKYSMDKGETMLWSYIDVPYRPGAGLAPMVPAGMRALSVAIGGAAGVSGLLHPNDRVDVLGSFSFPSRKNPQQVEWVTLTVMQNVTVLATGQNVAGAGDGNDRSRGSAGYSTVTLEVTPREAELLTFVENMRGHLTLSLRNPGDVTFEAELPEVNFDVLEKELPVMNALRQAKIRRKGGN
jgi:pilus assembly protein CpaB